MKVNNILPCLVLFKMRIAQKATKLRIENLDFFNGAGGSESRTTTSIANSC